MGHIVVTGDLVGLLATLLVAAAEALFLILAAGSGLLVTGLLAGAAALLRVISGDTRRLPRSSK